MEKMTWRKGHEI